MTLKTLGVIRKIRGKVRPEKKALYFVQGHRENGGPAWCFVGRWCPAKLKAFLRAVDAVVEGVGQQPPRTLKEVYTKAWLQRFNVVSKSSRKTKQAVCQPVQQRVCHVGDLYLQFPMSLHSNVPLTGEEGANCCAALGLEAPILAG